VVGSFFDLCDLRDRKTGALSDFRRVLCGDLTKLGHRFTGQDFDLEPNLELALVRPKIAHLRPGISIDHVKRIKARTETESVLYAKSAASRMNR
jgi:hypothetical protein